MAATPPVGPSTIILWILAAAIAAVGILQTGGGWLLAVSAGLVALNNALRSWQANGPEIYVVGEGGEHDDVDDIGM